MADLKVSVILKQHFILITERKKCLLVQTQDLL